MCTSTRRPCRTESPRCSLPGQQQQQQQQQWQQSDCSSQPAAAAVVARQGGGERAADPMTMTTPRTVLGPDGLKVSHRCHRDPTAQPNGLVTMGQQPCAKICCECSPAFEVQDVHVLLCTPHWLLVHKGHQLRRGLASLLELSTQLFPSLAPALRQA